VSVYSFREGPSYTAASREEMFTAAMDMPMNMGATFFDQAKGGTLESFGMGTAIRGSAIPPGDTSQLSTGERVGRTAQSLMPGGVIGTIGGAIRRLTDDPSPVLSEEAYKSSPFFRTDVPWDASMTEDRAAALASWHDAKAVRQYFATKRPITAFLGSVAGQAFDPINYFPVVGPAVHAAAAARAGRVIGTASTASADAALNTAIAGMATSAQREQFGDDVSWQAMITEIATAALIGAAFGGIAGGIDARRAAKVDAATQERMSTLRTAQEARIALNEGIDALARGEDINLSPNATSPIEARADQLRRILTEDTDIPNRPQKPVTLTQFIAATGGIVDESGELAAMGLSRKFVPGSGNLVRRSGRSVDYAREAAAEAGFFDDLYGPDEAVARSTPDDLMRLLGREASGETIFAPRLDGNRFADRSEYDASIRNSEEYKRVLDEVDDGLTELGIDHRVDDAVIRRAAELIKAEQLDRLDALERAIEEDYRVFYDGYSAQNPTFAKQGIPFFEDAGTAPFGSVVPDGAIAGRDGAGRGSDALNREQLSVARAPQRTPDLAGARPEPAPAGRAEAEKSITRTDDYAALKAQYRVDPETGDFLESAEIDQLRAEGRLTDEDIAALDAAQTELDNGTAYGEALKSAVACII
jgi:hypothetical protein